MTSRFRESRFAFGQGTEMVGLEYQSPTKSPDVYLKYLEGWLFIVARAYWRHFVV